MIYESCRTTNPCFKLLFKRNFWNKCVKTKANNLGLNSGQSWNKVSASYQDKFIKKLLIYHIWIRNDS